MGPTFFRSQAEENLTGGNSSERRKNRAKSAIRKEGGDMVSSAIFGAAAGTGLALFVAMTIVVYRYYAVRRKGKYWSSLDRWPDPPGTKKSETRQEGCSEHCHDASASHVLNCWRKQQKNYHAVQTTVCKICFSIWIAIRASNKNYEVALLYRKIDIFL